MSESNKPTQYTSDFKRYGASNWGVTLGLVAAVMLAGVLYFSFSGDLIERSTAIPPAASTPTGSATSAQPPVPATK